MTIKFKVRSETLEITDSVISDSEVEYTIEEMRGRGGNAVVYRCISNEDGIEYALKILTNPSKKKLKRFAKELDIFEKLNHPHIIKFVDSGNVDVSSVTTGKQKKTPFIIMELADIDLHTFLKERHFVIAPEIYIAQIRGLSDALSELHNYAIHRDIKPANILVSGERWLLSDFGLCYFDEDEWDITAAGEVIGPRYWMSPESNNMGLGIKGEKSQIIKSSDVFQLASVFWLIANGSHPTGVVNSSDWRGPEYLFDPIFNALQLSQERRPESGFQLLNQIKSAIEK